MPADPENTIHNGEAQNTMIGPMGGKRPRHRQFNYQPRFYDPVKEERERKRRAIRFESKVRRGQGKSIALYAAILMLLFLLLLYL
jgi:hypothetical protein